jgi:hypothetical protein
MKLSITHSSSRNRCPRRAAATLAIAVLCAALGLVSCSGQQQTETATTATTTSQPAQEQATTTNQPTTETTKTTKTTTTDSGHSSLLGATANFVWTVVSFPFRVVGDVLGEIF